MLPPDHVPNLTVDLVRPLYRAMTRYHDYKIEGLEHVPTHGPAIIVFNHSLATYDIFLFGATVYMKRHRLISSLADRAIFNTPGLAQMARHMGAAQGEPHMAKALLEAGRLAGVAPGGMREALRPSSKRYQLDWHRRIGFAKLAIEAQVPVILAACPAADEIFSVADSPITHFVYERFRLPLPIAWGPKRVKLLHKVSTPIHPPKQGDAHAFQKVLTERMEALMESALASRKAAEHKAQRHA